MFQVFELTHSFIVFVILFAAIFYVIRRAAGLNRSISATVLLIGFLLLTVVFYLSSISITSVKIDMQGASFESVLSHSVYASGIDDKNRLRTALEESTDGRAWVKMDLPPFLKADKISYAFKFEGRPQAFEINKVHLYASSPLGEAYLGAIEGDKLLQVLYPLNRDINDVSLNRGNLVVQPGRIAGEPWLKLFLYGEAGQFLWRSSNHLSMLRVAASWAALFALGVLILLAIPFVFLKARDFEAGRINTPVGRLSSWLASGMIILIVTMVTVLIAELIVRLYYKDVLSTQASATYFSKKSAAKFASEKNNWGYRGSDFSVKSADRFRVVVMGDSFAYGRGIFPHTKRFPELLEKKFNEKYNKDIEVINLGVSGMNLHNYFKFVSFVLKTKPDYLLYQWYVNDMDIEYDNEVKPKPYTQIIPYQSVHLYLHKNSALYYIFERAVGKIQFLLADKQSYNDRLQSKYSQGQDRDNALRLLKAVLDKIQTGTKQYGIVLFPDTSSLNNIDDYSLGFLHDMVNSECVGRGIACLDLREAYHAFDGRVKDAWVNVFDSHPSEEAHALAANALLDFYGDSWNQMIDDAQAESRN